MLKLGHLAQPRRFTTHGAFVIMGSDITSSPDEDKGKQSCGSQEAPTKVWALIPRPVSMLRTWQNGFCKCGYGYGP